MTIELQPLSGLHPSDPAFDMEPTEQDNSPKGAGYWVVLFIGFVIGLLCAKGC
jgi:hypothetical protein